MEVGDIGNADSNHRGAVHIIKLLERRGAGTQTR